MSDCQTIARAEKCQTSSGIYPPVPFTQSIETQFLKSELVFVRKVPWLSAREKAFSSLSRRTFLLHNNLPPIPFYIAWAQKLAHLENVKCESSFSAEKKKLDMSSWVTL